MQSATAAELEAKRKAIPRQSVTYTLDTIKWASANWQSELTSLSQLARGLMPQAAPWNTNLHSPKFIGLLCNKMAARIQMRSFRPFWPAPCLPHPPFVPQFCMQQMLQAEFMVANGMHLPGQGHAAARALPRQLSSTKMWGKQASCMNKMHGFGNEKQAGNDKRAGNDKQAGNDKPGGNNKQVRNDKQAPQHMLSCSRLAGRPDTVQNTVCPIHTQDAYPFSKLLYDDDWRFAPALPQRTKGMYRPFSYAGDEAEFLGANVDGDRWLVCLSKVTSCAKAGPILTC
eukprot:1159571-Pelagomonas_calceolata.AAC.5